MEPIDLCGNGRGRSLDNQGEPTRPLKKTEARPGENYASKGNDELLAYGFKSM